MDEENSNQNVTIESSSNENETGPLSKKRKLSIGETSSSNIEIKLLQSAIVEWKQYAQKLEAEKRQHIDKCNQDKILELEDTVAKLQSTIAEENVEEIKKQLSDSEKRNKENQKKFGETALKNEQLEQKCKEMEETIKKNIEESESTIDALNADKNNLSKTNMDLMNNEKEIQKNINELKKKVEKDRSETKILSLDEIFHHGSKLKTSLLSCKSKIVVNLTKLENTSRGWNLYSTTNNSEKPRFLKEKDMLSNCFSMNIYGQLLMSYGSQQPPINQIMHKIITCELTKLVIIKQTIDLADYIKLTSSKTIQICVFELSAVKLIIGISVELSVDQLLTYIPNVIKFKYECYEHEMGHSTLAKNLGRLQAFPNLQKFEILDLSESFKFEDLETFLKKNNKDISYTFTFSGPTPMKMQNEIEAAKNELLKSLSVPYKFRLGFKANYGDPIVWV